MSLPFVKALLLCIAVILLCSGFSPSLAADKPPVFIGALYNVTGAMASIDGPALNGAKLAAKRVNAKGGILDGRKVEILAFDTGTDLKKAAAMARDAVSRGVAAGIGYGDSDFVLAAAPVFREKGIPFVTSGATDPALPSRVGGLLYLAAFGDDGQAAAMAGFAYSRLKVRRVVLWTDRTTDFTRTLSGYFRKSFTASGGTIIREDLFKPGDAFSGLVALLKKDGTKADALFVSGVPSEAGPVVKAVREEGITLPILSGDGFDTELVTAIPGKVLADGVYFSTHVYLGDKAERVRDFVETYTREYGKAPENAFAALGYDAVGLVTDAIARAKTAEGGAVAGALGATKGYKGVTGDISYGSARGIPEKTVSIIGVKSGTQELMEVWRPQ